MLLMTTPTTNCWIYHSSKKDEMYLYLPIKDNFDDIPAPLMQQFGTPRFVMSLTLSRDKPLARADVKAVITALSDPGYYLQLPPKLEPKMYYGE